MQKKEKNAIFDLPEELPAEEDPPLPEFTEENSDIFLLRRELSLLSEKYRRAVILYYIERKPCAEIARLLSISESMVKYLLFKARKRLKEGMTMDRKLGTLSYNPKSFIPMYHGSGSNHFWRFMESPLKQNILLACYNDSLTPEQISLETGIPLPYLDDDIKALTEKALLLKDGPRYKAGVIIITADCTEEIARSALPYQTEIADKIEKFLTQRLNDFKKIGFTGADSFSEHTLRWQLLSFVLMRIMCFKTNVLELNDASAFPKTAWGDHAYLWLTEKYPPLTTEYAINFSQVFDDREKHRIHFCYNIDSLKGSPHDFESSHYSGILLDIAKAQFCGTAHCEASQGHFSEYDLEVIAELIRKGYILNEKDGYRTTMPIFTAKQYTDALALVKEFLTESLGGVLQEFDRRSAEILSAHTPKHLQKQVPVISGMHSRYRHAVNIPAGILLERKVITTAWSPVEMPTTYIVLNA